MKPLSYRVERALEPYSAAAGARPKVSRPLSVQQSRTKMKEEGWNQCHHVVQEFERQVVLQKRIDSNREQRLEQLKLLHLSYDQIKEQRLAKEERQSQRQQQLVLREREKRSCGDKQGAQQRGKREQISGLDFEELMAKSMTPHRAEKEAKKEEEDEEREYLLEQEQFEVDDDELGDDEEKETGRNEEELKEKEKVKENSDTIILSKEVNQTHGMLQGDVKHQLPLEEKIKSPPTTSHSEQQQQDATLPSLVRETESQRVHRSPRAVLNDLQVQVDEPHNLQTRAEAADVKKIVEKKSKESSPSVHQIEESQKTNTECGTQDPQEQAEEVPIMDTAGEKECPQVIRSRSNSLPSGAFRPQSAAYLIAQREACQGSLETSQSGEGKDAFSPDSSPLKGTMSRSPVIGLGIPQQSQYYLGESDSFADFHPRKGGFAHHPFTPVLQSSKDDVKCALEGKDDSDLPTIHAPDIRVVEGEVPDITCESKKNISARKTPTGGGGGVGG